MRLFDLHCDTLTEAFATCQPLLHNRLHLDLERGCRFEEWRQVFAVWTPDTLRGEAAWRRTKAVLAFAAEQERQFTHRLRFLKTKHDTVALQPGQCGGILALESGAPLAGELSRVEEATRLGVKIITLTWNGENELGYGCMSQQEEGLKPFGKAAVKEMERWGIIPDVSHLNRGGFWDVAALTQYPFIASHSVSDAVHSHPRNLTDEQFDEIRCRGGLVGLNVCKEQLGEPSFDAIRRHLDHFLERDGVRTVGFGCDFDGTDLPPEWTGIGMMEALYDYLCRKNYEEWVLKRIFFSNCNDFFTNRLDSFDKR